MDTKDYIIIGLIVLVVGGPVGVHLYHRGQGKVRKQPQATDYEGGSVGGSVITDTIRLGSAVAMNGGKTIAEGAKLVKQGSLRYHNREQGKSTQMVGGA
jgi:hypothetical protein